MARGLWIYGFSLDASLAGKAEDHMFDDPEK
jgi:hypothetical protein